MRIAVMGAGSIGGYFGGMLARGGHEVTLVARGEHLRAIQEAGLTVVRDAEEFTLRCPQEIDASGEPSRVGPVDLVLLTVKTYQNPVAVPATRPLLGPDTTVLCLQNGVDSYQEAARTLGPGRVLPGAAYIEASRPRPGVVQQTGEVVRIVFGEEDGEPSPRGVAILRALEDSGIPAELSRDIRRDLWSKFLFIVTLAGVTALARERLAQLWDRPEWHRIIVGCLRETEGVARAAGVDLAGDIVESTLAYLEGSLAELQASMHSDLTAGRPLELEALTGAVVRAGTAVRVPTPINDLIYAMLLPQVSGDRAGTEAADL